MNSPSNEYMKIDDEKIQTPIITLENSKGTTVNLVGALHIASPKYYDEIFSILNRNDVVLYEQVKKEKEQTLKDKMIFLNNISTSELYKNLSESVNMSSDKKISKIFNECIKNNPEKKLDYEKYKQELLDQMKVVYQWEQIDYEHLPDSREHADISTKDITKGTRIISWQNMKYLGIKVLTSIVKFSIDEFGGDFFSSLKNNEWKSPLRKLDWLREQKVLDKIEEHEYKNTQSKIWVFYGSAHLENLEKQLKERWYKRTNIEYIEAVRKLPLAA